MGFEQFADSERQRKVFDPRGLGVFLGLKLPYPPQGN